MWPVLVPPPCVEGREGGKQEYDFVSDCGLWRKELGFLLPLYYGGAIIAIRSGMDGRKQLGRLG